MSLKIKNRHRLRKKEVKDLISDITETFSNNFFDEKSLVDIGNIEEFRIVFVDDLPTFILYEDKIVFTLHGLDKFSPRFYYITVDMGAVKFVTSGADVMAPGIVNADENICKGDSVWICDEKHRKPLAVGIAIMSGENMVLEKKGIAIKVIHYVGDKLWKIIDNNI